MGIWSSLFNSSDTISKATDALIRTGDKLVYTAEEKADNKFKIMAFMPKLLESYSAFKIAQRILAIWFSLLYGISFLCGISMEIFNIYTKYQGMKLGLKLKEIVLLDTQPLINMVGAFSLGTIVLTIIGFYFFGGTLSSISRKDK